MNIKELLSATYIAFSKLSKYKLLKALQSLREKYIELEETITQLKAENAKLKEPIWANDSWHFSCFRPKIKRIFFPGGLVA